MRVVVESMVRVVVLLRVDEENGVDRGGRVRVVVEPMARVVVLLSIEVLDYY